MYEGIIRMRAVFSIIHTTFDSIRFWFRFDFCQCESLPFQVCEVVLLSLMAHKTYSVSVAAFGRLNVCQVMFLGNTTV